MISTGRATWLSLMPYFIRIEIDIATYHLIDNRNECLFCNSWGIIMSDTATYIKPSADQVSSHIQMSRMMTIDKFLELQKNNQLPIEVMLEPQVSWFTEEGCNYPVGAIEWAENFVNGDITIYSSVFHQAYMSAGRRYDSNAKSGSSGFVSAIAITVSKVNQSKEVRLEMTVGHDKVMVITKDKLVLKEKYSSRVFEVWYRIVKNGRKYWRITHSLRGVMPDNDLEWSPLYLTSFCQRMICFMQTQMKLSSEDLKKARNEMNSQLSKIDLRHRISLVRKTPPIMEQLYLDTVKDIYDFSETNVDSDIVNCFIDNKFTEFLSKFKEFLDNDSGTLLTDITTSTEADY